MVFYVGAIIGFIAFPIIFAVIGICLGHRLEIFGNGFFITMPKKPMFISFCKNVKE